MLQQQDRGLRRMFEAEALQHSFALAQTSEVCVLDLSVFAPSVTGILQTMQPNDVQFGNPPGSTRKPVRGVAAVPSVVLQRLAQDAPRAKQFRQAVYPNVMGRMVRDGNAIGVQQRATAVQQPVLKADSFIPMDRTFSSFVTPLLRSAPSVIS
jgi:hypothetical protein